MPYIQGRYISTLLLDQMKSHMQPNFIDSVDALGIRVNQIPGRFASVSQICDVGTIVPFKSRSVELCEG